MSKRHEHLGLDPMDESMLPLMQQLKRTISNADTMSLSDGYTCSSSTRYGCGYHYGSYGKATAPLPQQWQPTITTRNFFDWEWNASQSRMYTRGGTVHGNLEHSEIDSDID